MLLRSIELTSSIVPVAIGGGIIVKFYDNTITFFVSLCTVSKSTLLVFGRRKSSSWEETSFGTCGYTTE